MESELENNKEKYEDLLKAAEAGKEHMKRYIES